MTNESEGTKYDDAEALSLLAGASEALSRDRQAADKAGIGLLAELVRLDGRTNIGISKTGSENTVVVSVGRPSGLGVLVQCLEGEFMLAGQNVGQKEWSPIPGLRYNPATERFEGGERDEYRTPAAGAPRAMRSALAVVLEHALKRLDEIYPKEAKKF